MYTHGRVHTGHFRLTSLLLPSLLKSPDGRVVTVSSSAHLFSPTVEWGDLNAQAPGAYAPWTAYGLSKLSNILFTKALQKRVDQKGGTLAHNMFLSFLDSVLRIIFVSSPIILVKPITVLHR